MITVKKDDDGSRKLIHDLCIKNMEDLHAAKIIIQPKANILDQLKLMKKRMNCTLHGDFYNGTDCLPDELQKINFKCMDEKHNIFNIDWIKSMNIRNVGNTIELISEKSIISHLKEFDEVLVDSSLFVQIVYICLNKSARCKLILNIDREHYKMYDNGTNTLGYIGPSDSDSNRIIGLTGCVYKGIYVIKLSDLYFMSIGLSGILIGSVSDYVKMMKYGLRDWIHRDTKNEHETMLRLKVKEYCYKRRFYKWKFYL